MNSKQWFLLFLGILSFVGSIVLIGLGLWGHASRSGDARRLVRRVALLSSLQGLYLVAATILLGVESIAGSKWGAVVVLAGSSLASYVTWHVGLRGLRDRVPSCSEHPPGAV